MKIVISSGRFKKDLKRYRSKPEILKKLYEVVGILERGLTLPKYYKPPYANWRIQWTYGMPYRK